MDASVLELLGGEETIGTSIASNLDLARATRVGLPSGSTDALARWLAESVGPMLIEIGLGARPIFVESNKPSRLTVEKSDHLVRTATVVAKAAGVLGERAKAVHWLTSANLALGNESPLSLLDTSAGEHEVLALLDRIEFGVYS